MLRQKKLYCDISVGILACFQAHYTSHGVSLSKLPIFLSFCYEFLFLIDLRVVLEQIFICIEEISVLYSDIQFIYC